MYVPGGHPSPPLSDGPAGRARLALLDHWDEPDAFLVKRALSTLGIVQRARAELEDLGAIPVRDPGLSDDAYTAGPGQRAEAELLADPARSNPIVADAARVHLHTVARVRARLESLGEIPVVTRHERRRRPGSGAGDQREPRGVADSDLTRYPELPPQPPSMALGLCVTGHHDPDLWHPQRGGDDRGQQAIALCLQCPALADCAAWSLSLTSKDRAIYGAMTATERHARKMARLRA